MEYTNNGPIYLTQKQYNNLTPVSGQEYRIIDEPYINATAIADTYSTTSSYNVGDIVNYNGDLYTCTTAISNSDFTESNWSKLDSLASYFGDINTLLTELNGE